MIHPRADTEGLTAVCLSDIIQRMISLMRLDVHTLSSEKEQNSSMLVSFREALMKRTPHPWVNILRQQRMAEKLL